MKYYKLFYLFGCLLTGMASISCSSDNEDFSTKPISAEEAGYGTFTDVPIDELTCYKGGSGHAECKIEPGIKIGDFVTMGCSVSCQEGYYACCGIRCICRPEVSK